MKLKHTIALMVWLLLGVSANAELKEPQKAILVTGASSGIGLNITKRLAADGYFVYAGARKDQDLAELNEMHNVQAVRLDVRSEE
ncbi:MAG: SDR family NAD(P)-dependent oxidoreductase, partial [Woeseia sp.]